jgi:hypothetical protein
MRQASAYRGEVLSPKQGCGIRALSDGRGACEAQPTLLVREPSRHGPSTYGRHPASRWHPSARLAVPPAPPDHAPPVGRPRLTGMSAAQLQQLAARLAPPRPRGLGSDMCTGRVAPLRSRAARAGRAQRRAPGGTGCVERTRSGRSLPYAGHPRRTCGRRIPVHPRAGQA